MPSLLLKVHRKMSITVHRKVRSVLEGEYASVFKGRSMDFDDLREYVPGDDVKDIEWRATARSGQVRIKRYVAIRKHHIMLVVDTGRSMAATAPSGECKRDIAVMVAGVIASVAQKHGDLVGLTAGNQDTIFHLPMKGSRAHLERILQYINSRTTLDAPSSQLTNLLDYIRRSIRRRMLLVVVSDNLQFAAAQEQLLRRLAAQHELMFVAIDDVDPADVQWRSKAVYDVDEPVALPTFIRRNKSVETAYQELLHTEWGQTIHSLEHIRVSSVRIDSEAAVVNQVIRLLEKFKHGRR